MDSSQGVYGGGKPPGESVTNGPGESVVQNKTGPASPSTTHSRHSPVAPLAPLEFLQNQRRGSITDPSLHAAGVSGVVSSGKPPSSRQQQPPDPSATLGRLSPVSPRLHEYSLDRDGAAKLQASPPYRFGEPSSAQPSVDHQGASSPNLRRLLRSPAAGSDAGGSRAEGDHGREGTTGQGNYSFSYARDMGTLSYRRCVRLKSPTQHEWKLTHKTRPHT